MSTRTRPRRLLAAAGLVLATTLAATGCIGTEQKEIRAGSPLKVVVHPGFENVKVPTNRSGVFLTTDYRRSSSPAAARRVPIRVRLSFTGINPATKRFANYGTDVVGGSSRNGMVKDPNGSYSVTFVAPTTMCRTVPNEANIPVRAYATLGVTWSDGSVEWTDVPVVAGWDCYDEGGYYRP